jgi:hypothetical protein
VSVSPLQLVNLHRKRRYFVIKLHTWFCLSYFLKTNIKLYCIYQYFISINSLQLNNLSQTLKINIFTLLILYMRPLYTQSLYISWLILLKNTILLMKSQLVTSYTVKHDVNRCFLNPGALWRQWYSDIVFYFSNQGGVS